MNVDEERSLEEYLSTVQDDTAYLEDAFTGTLVPEGDQDSSKED